MARKVLLTLNEQFAEDASKEAANLGLSLQEYFICAASQKMNVPFSLN